MLFRPLLSTKVFEATQLLANSFVHHEPLTSHLQLDEASFAKWAHHTITSSMNEGLAFVAANRTGQEIGAIQGVMIAESMKNSLNHAELYPEAQPIFEILHDLYKSQQSHMYDRLDTSAHIFLGATRTNATGQGICHELAKYSLLCMKTQGYTDIYAALTAPGTQHIFLNKLSFKPLNTITFSEYSSPAFKTCPGKVVLAHHKFT